MRRLLFFLCALLGGGFVYAQGSAVLLKGAVADTATGVELQHVSVVLIHAADSTLAAHARTGADGIFTLSAPAAGRYFLLYTHPAFADLVDEITVEPVADAAPRDLGRVTLVSRTQLLQEVVVKGRTAVQVRGDTVEYIADSFATTEGATVEDLLKKLPGLRVDRAGKVTAHGQSVEKILVDGEEFFSDDPAVVTKNLQAVAVDKVQVFDRKSDAAEATGIDDGERLRTLNLQLKDSYKKGVFGKLQAGGGTDGYFENQAMINAFRGKRQVSVFGIGANTGRVGLGWEDRQKYGGASFRMGGGDDDEGGGFYIMDGGGDDDDGLQTNWQGQYGGEGLPKVWTGGAHYADKWAEDRQHLNANYRTATNIFENEAGTTTQYLLPDSTYTRNQARTTLVEGTRHSADARWEWKPDSATTVRLSASGSMSSTVSNTRTSTGSFSESGAAVNRSERALLADADKGSGGFDFSLNRKLKKTGRSFAVNASGNGRDTKTESDLRVLNTFYDAGFSDTVNQRKDYDIRALNLGADAAYTEPISKKFFLFLNYAFANSASRSSRLSFDRTPGNETEEVLARDFSSDYRFGVRTHTGGTGLRYVTKKVTVSVSNAVGFTRFSQDDRLADTGALRNYVNLFPRASFSWRNGRQQSFSIRYNGATRQPRIEEIQPIRDNTDPLNVALGNPALRQEFNHNVNLSYNNYKVLTGTYTYAGGGGSASTAEINQASFVDEVGRRTTQYVNVNGAYSFYFYGGQGTTFKPLDTRVGYNANLNTNRNIAIVNGQQGTTLNNAYSLGLSFDKTWNRGKSDTEIASIELQPSFTYHSNNSSLTELAQSYWTAELTAEASLQLPWRLRLETEARMDFRQRTEVFPTNNNVIRWDAYLARKWGKKNPVEARFAVFDILNQNLGFQRNAASNYITENRYLTVRRYGLLSLVWNFTYSPGGAPASGGNSIIIDD